MSKRYFAYRYRDGFDAFENALQRAGYQSVDRPQDADMLFLDHEQRLREIDRPLFLYPHTPYAFWLWDGLVEPSAHTLVNFVMSDAGRASMQAYGYPHRVEVVGFSRCPVLPFRPTGGRTLVYASAHLFPRGRWPHEGDRILHERTLQWLIRYRSAFDRILVYYYGSLEDNGLQACESAGLTPIDVGLFSSLNTRTALRQLQTADVVISSNANGIPTILVGHDNEFPGHSTNNGNHYAQYEKYCAFPLRLQEMTAGDVLALRSYPLREVEDWKQLNLGCDFDADRFISAVREAV